MGPDKEPIFASDEQEALEEEATELQEAAPEARAPADLDSDLEKLDGYLDQVEASTRRYFWSWLAVGSALTASQLYVATSWESDQQDIIRGSYWIGTALGGTSLILQLISPKPALFGVSRYRKLPSGSPEEKQAKLEYGEHILAGQAKADMRATSVTQHITGVVAALGSGLGVGLGWDNSLKQAITRSLGVFLVAELQIISRPRTSIQLVDSWSQHSVQVALVPMLERDAQGLMLAGTF
ncbi:MAG: hypothetical protein ABW352_04015 [Polyangiales bacterium]